MADHDATLRLNLAAAGMLTMLRTLEQESGKLANEIQDIGDESQQAGRKLHPMLAGAKKGLGAAKSAAVDLGGSLKSAVGQALTLGGALSTMGGAHQAVTLNSLYKDTAFAIRTATGEAHSFEQVQADVEKTANKWKRTNEEVARSYDDIFRQTQNLDFTRAATDAVSAVANATGKSHDLLGKLAGDLGQKFNVSAAEIGDALASVVSTGRIEELSQNMHEIGAAAHGMGLTGAAGLAKYIGMLELAKGSMKDVPTAVASLRGLTEPLENLEATKGIEQKLKIKLRTDDGQVRKDALQEILKATGGQRQELAQIFSGDTLNLVSDFGKAYQKGFDSLGGTFKEKSEAGIVAFNKALADASKGKITFAEIQEEGAKRLEDTQRKFADAMNKFVDAFAKPETIAAMEKMAASMPKLADAIAGLVEFGVENPALAAGGVVGGHMATAAVGAVAPTAGAALLKKMFGTGAAEVATEGSKAAAKQATMRTAATHAATKAGPLAGGLAGAAIMVTAERALSLANVATSDDKKKALGKHIRESTGGDLVSDSAFGRITDAVGRMGLPVISDVARAAGTGRQVAAVLDGGDQGKAAEKTERAADVLEKGADKSSRSMTSAATKLELAADKLLAAHGSNGKNGLPPPP